MVVAFWHKISLCCVKFTLEIFSPSTYSFFSWVLHFNLELGISSPINGSALARFLGKNNIIQKILGQGGGNDLATTKENGFTNLGEFPSSAKVLVISGTFGFNPLFSEKNDGKVSVQESCLARDHHHEYVHAGHSWICKSITTINLIDQFLSDSLETSYVGSSYCCR